MKRSDIGRPKLVALEVALRAAGEAHPAIVAAGIWTKLDHLASAHAPIGDVGRFTDAHLAAACGWTGDGAWLVRTLLETGWLLPHTEHRLVLADWWEDSDDCHHRAVWRLRLRFWDGRAPRLTKLGAPGTRERLAAEAFYGLRAADPELPITETLGSQAGSPSRPVPSSPARTSPRTRAAGRCQPHEQPSARSRREGHESELSLLRPTKGSAIALHRPVEPSWAPSPDEEPVQRGRCGEGPFSAVAAGQQSQERSVASLVFEMQSRLCDQGEPSNLWVIAERMPPYEIERGLFVVCGRAKDGLLPIGVTPAGYFVGCMKKRARELGMRLDFGRRAVGS